MDSRRHWDSVYASKPPDRVSWFRPHLDRSLEYLRLAGMDPDDAIIDVGGGASTFVDDLLDRGYSNVTVLDFSEEALRLTRARLGDRAGDVTWLCADATDAALPRGGFRFWHDRAVFHFLRDATDRARYVATLWRSLARGGHALIATFGPGGPEKCSGLDVRRYDAESLRTELGSGFEPVADATETHTTPAGAAQEFVYGLFRRSM
jgi:SAM-dependent methyltransferase